MASFLNRSLRSLSLGARGKTAGDGPCAPHPAGSIFPTRWQALALGLLWLAAGPALAATPAVPRDLFSVKAEHSRSGQFIARGLPLPPSPNLRDAAREEISYVRLDPSLAMVICERIKQEFLRELNLTDQWRGTIHLEIHPLARDNQSIHITQVRYADGWGYYLRMPELVNRSRLLNALTQVLLSELANRQAGREPAELPPWLVQGLSARLQSISIEHLAPNPATTLATRNVEWDRIKSLRELLRRRPILSFDQLSWPTEEQFDAGSDFYRGCAALFVHELMRLNHGRACLARMIQRLPQNLNWQTTFLQAFPQFSRLADAAKWWSLISVQFSGLDTRVAWTFDQTFMRLEEILATPAQVRLGPKALPVETTLTLQAMLKGWEFPRQAPIFALKLNHLQALRFRAAPELLSLIDGYVQTLSLYLNRRDQTSRLRPHKQQSAPSPKLITRDAIKQLDALDAQRRALRDPTQTAHAREAVLRAGRAGRTP